MNDSHARMLTGAILILAACSSATLLTFWRVIVGCAGVLLVLSGLIPLEAILGKPARWFRRAVSDANSPAGERDRPTHDRAD